VEALSKLAQLPGSSAARKYLEKNSRLLDCPFIDHLTAEVVKLTHVDMRAAGRLAQLALLVAVRMGDDHSRGRSLRAFANIQYLKGNYPKAYASYRAALQYFDRAKEELETALTLNSALQTLIYLGKYDLALGWAERARTIFRRRRDHLRLARLDSNTANIYYRRDQFEKALESYHRAYHRLRRIGQPSDVVSALVNMATCYISLNDFTAALANYKKAKQHCQRNGLPLQEALADYNVAYLYYLRGEYTQAMDAYRLARKHAQRVGDRYISNLCDLDQSEMLLELNLSVEGAKLARQAVTGFHELKMRYEAAKALANLAIAASHQMAFTRALDLFGRARQLFVRERNQVWVALIDLYQAVVLYRWGRSAEARRLAEKAFRYFRSSPFTSKAALSMLLLAQIDLQAGQPEGARQKCRAVLSMMRWEKIPSIIYRAYFVLGQAKEQIGDLPKALNNYRKAHAQLENLQSQLRGEELKIAFLKDKQEVYENLVYLYLSTLNRAKASEQVFQYIEQAKSRSLTDMIAFRASSIPAPQLPQSELVNKVHRLREKLNWEYRQIDLQEVRMVESAGDRISRLRTSARETEKQLVDALSDLRIKDWEFALLQNAGSLPIQQIQGVIPHGSMLVEYYEARGRLYAFLARRKGSLEVIDIGPSARIRSVFRLLQFQMSKYGAGAGQNDPRPQVHGDPALHHLQELYAALIRPVVQRTREEHLIIVPHAFLHYLPFHALFDGREHLIDQVAVSYAPSASVFFLCSAKGKKSGKGALVLGVPDAMAPAIKEEALAVASILPQSRLFLGEKANRENLEKYAHDSRYIHLATHGLFRSDNPIFSGIRLGDSRLSLFDLYQLRLPCDLITLSGCGTGLNVVAEGDELLGMTRGLLYAGARAALVTLWDAHDRSTTLFMKSFYTHLSQGINKAKALRMAMLAVRNSHGHPFYWAPFMLIGQV
jgi:CHAT domain-containing protein